MQDINLSQIKLKLNDTYKKKGEKKTTKIESFNDEDFVNKVCLHTNLAEVVGHITFIERDTIKKMRRDKDAKHQLNLER